MHPTFLFPYLQKSKRSTSKSNNNSPPCSSCYLSISTLSIIDSPPPPYHSHALDPYTLLSSDLPSAGLLNSSDFFREEARKSRKDISSRWNDEKVDLKGALDMDWIKCDSRIQGKSSFPILWKSPPPS